MTKFHGAPKEAEKEDLIEEQQLGSVLIGRYQFFRGNLIQDVFFLY